MKVYVIQTEMSSGIPDEPEVFLDPNAACTYADIVQEWLAEFGNDEPFPLAEGESISWAPSSEPHAFLAWDEDRTLRAWTVEVSHAEGH